MGSELFGSRIRARVLRLLFVDCVEGSGAELARLAEVDGRGVREELAKLERAGLVVRHNEGRRTVAAADMNHPASGALRDFLTSFCKPVARPEDTSKLRETLAAFGAPLLVGRKKAWTPLEEALLDGLAAARKDPIILRVLPIVLATLRSRVAWPQVKIQARRRRLAAELGMLVELTADLLGEPSLAEMVLDLHDRRYRKARFFPEVSGQFEARLAEDRTPEAARRWGFRMNISFESLKAAMEKHLA